MDDEARRTRQALFGGLFMTTAPPVGAKARRELLEPARDLHRDLAAHPEAEVLLLMFGLPDCPYCEVVRRNYLASLARDPAYGRRLLIREVGLDGDSLLIDIDGAASSGRALARRYDAKVAPTVVFLDRRGQPLAEPLIGGDIAGFYGAYLDSALAKALRR